jgi:Ca2+-binding EF-hand superfamily protein
MALSLREQVSEQDITQTFKVFDPDKTGIIVVEKLRLIIMNLVAKLTEAEIDELIQEIDRNKMGNRLRKVC